MDEMEISLDLNFSAPSLSFRSITFTLAEFSGNSFEAGTLSGIASEIAMSNSLASSWGTTVVGDIVSIGWQFSFPAKFQPEVFITVQTFGMITGENG